MRKLRALSAFKQRLILLFRLEQHLQDGRLAGGVKQRIKWLKITPQHSDEFLWRSERNRILGYIWFDRLRCFRDDLNQKASRAGDDEVSVCEVYGGCRGDTSAVDQSAVAAGQVTQYRAFLVAFDHEVQARQVLVFGQGEVGDVPSSQAHRLARFNPDALSRLRPALDLQHDLCNVGRNQISLRLRYGTLGCRRSSGRTCRLLTMPLNPDRVR